MDVQTTKIELLKAILEMENEELIQRVADFVEKEKTDIWNDLNTSQREEIKKGLKELDEGKRVSLESVMKKIS